MGLTQVGILFYTVFIIKIFVKSLFVFLLVSVLSKYILFQVSLPPRLVFKEDLGKKLEVTSLVAALCSMHLSLGKIWL